MATQFVLNLQNLFEIKWLLLWVKRGVWQKAGRFVPGFATFHYTAPCAQSVALYTLQSVASSCALILIVTQDCADIHCDFAFCFFNHLGCCKGIVFIINHYNESPINIILKNNVYNLELQVFPDHFSYETFPRNYRFSKNHFRFFALV